jgi:hypothetical protein
VDGLRNRKGLKEGWRHRVVLPFILAAATTVRCHHRKEETEEGDGGASSAE